VRGRGIDVGVAAPANGRALRLEVAAPQVFVGDGFLIEVELVDVQLRGRSQGYQLLAPLEGGELAAQNLLGSGEREGGGQGDLHASLFI